MKKNKIKVFVINTAAATFDHQQYFSVISKKKNIDLTMLISPFWSFDASGTKSIIKSLFHKFKKSYADNYDNKSGYKLIKKIPLFPGKSFHFYPFLFLYLNKIKPDIIHIIFEPYNIITLQTILWKNIFKKNCKVLFSSHENMVRTYQDRYLYGLIFYDIIEKYNLKHMDAAIGATEQVKEVLYQKGISRKKQVEVVGDEIDTTIFKKVDAKNLRKKLKLKEFTIGFGGRLEKEKGILTVIDAVSLIKEKVKLMIIGWSNTGFENVIKKKIKQKKIEEKVIFINKKLSLKNLIKHMNCMDVIVVPSITTKYWKEQFGRMNIMGMGCEVAIIGSNSGSMPFVIKDAGLIFKENDPEDLKNKILKLLKNKTLRIKLAKMGRERVLKNFDYNITAENTYNLYKKLLKEKT